MTLPVGCLKKKQPLQSGPMQGTRPLAIGITNSNGGQRTNTREVLTPNQDRQGRRRQGRDVAGVPHRTMALLGPSTSEATSLLREGKNTAGAAAPKRSPQFTFQPRVRKTSLPTTAVKLMNPMCGQDPTELDMCVLSRERERQRENLFAVDK